MEIIKAMAFILAGYLVSGTACAKEVCPTGPLETDVRVIAAAIDSHPLRPRVWDASGNSNLSGQSGMLRAAVDCLQVSFAGPPCHRNDTT